eukprot:COSAG06_NODE_392_length_16344_cov_4.086981_13_plen_47_part_00
MTHVPEFIESERLSPLRALPVTTADAISTTRSCEIAFLITSITVRK